MSNFIFNLDKIPSVWGPVYIDLEYKFEIKLIKEQLDYFVYLLNNYEIILEKYNYDKGIKNSPKVVSVDSLYIKLANIYNDKVIINGKNNYFPEFYFACLQETLKKFNSDEIFVFAYKAFNDLYKIKLSKDYYFKETRNDLLCFE